MRSSVVFCNSVSADRIVMAASRLLRAVAAFVILLSFAAGSRKSYWSGCMKAATVICQQIFSILALVIFLLKILLKSASKSSFFRSGVEIHPVLELQFPTPLRVVLLCFATQSLQIAFNGATISDAVARSFSPFCSDLPSKNPQNRLFFALASRSGFGATISDAVARSSIVFCNSVSADRIVMAGSRLLRAVAALVILLSFAAGSRKSYWSGCMKAATWIC